jgi:flagellin
MPKKILKEERMALYVNTNVPALGSQRQVGLIQNSLNKSIQRLSSGLRINTAADDAAGLSIADTLKNQITGYNRAFLNVQDGMSLLQVADGTLGEIDGMLNRMKELATQAANGTYTANDRLYIQKEIDQLKDEINKTSYATEFNTKKLLDGSGIGVGTANSPDTQIVFTDKVQSANYNVQVETTPGKNAVYQTNVLQNINSGKTADITTGKNIVKDIKPLDAPANDPITGNPLRYNFEVDDKINNGDDKDKMIMASPPKNNDLDKIDNRLKDYDVNRSGYLLIQMNKPYPGKDEKVDGKSFDNYVTLTWYDANGDGTETVNVPAVYDDNKNDLNVDLTSLSAFNSGTLNLENIKDFNPGDKVLLSISDRNSIDKKTGPEEYTVSLHSFSNPKVTTDIQFNKLSGTNQTFQQVEMDENGNVWTYKYGVNFADNIGKIKNKDSNVNFTVKETKASEPVTEDTKLKDIKQFVTSDGQSTFATSKDLIVYNSSGKQAKIHLTGEDTVKDLEDKLKGAITELGLASNDPLINDKLVTFVTPGNKSMFDGNVVSEGSIVIQTAVPGKDGRLFFSGDEKLLQGLSVSQIRQSEENTRTAKVYDLYNGTLIGSEVLKDNKMVSTINGVEVYFNSKPIDYGQAKWANGGIEFQPYTESYDIHILDNQRFVHAGANAEQKIEFIIPQVDTKALGIDNVSVVTPDAAEESLYYIDNAQNILNNARGVVGAQMNRLEHRMNEINVMSENMSAGESRIRDLDMAKEMTNFTKNQILSQASTAMLAQANMMPQLVLQLLGGR